MTVYTLVCVTCSSSEVSGEGSDLASVEAPTPWCQTQASRPHHRDSWWGPRVLSCMGPEWTLTQPAIVHFWTNEEFAFVSPPLWNPQKKEEKSYLFSNGTPCQSNAKMEHWPLVWPFSERLWENIFWIWWTAHPRILDPRQPWAKGSCLPFTAAQGKHDCLLLGLWL